MTNEAKPTPNGADQQPEPIGVYQIPVPLMAEIMQLIGELPGKMSWQVMAKIASMRPTKD